MMAMCFIVGVGGITSFTIRISATQSYVPDERKGRFNGAFNMISTAGALTGELLAGGLTLVLPERIVVRGNAGVRDCRHRLHRRRKGARGLHLQP